MGKLIADPYADGALPAAPNLSMTHAGRMQP
jgi:hypothetical protein